jgi:3-oxoacyl-[acyl-carrier protein] reductase
VAIVTGASRGIGEAIAVKLAAHGAHVVITGTNEERLTLVAKKVNEINQECLVFTGNVANPKSAQNLVEETMQRFNRIDILVNNAGINMRIPTLSLTPEDWCKVIDTNLNGTFYTCAAVLPIMVQQRYGRIVNVSSSTSKTPHRNASPSYGASKAGVNYLTQHLAYEMAKHNIRVNAVCPGPIETDMSQQWNEEYRKELLKRIPLGHTGKTRDVANAVLFLASDSCDFITGETININGGTYMN